MLATQVARTKPRRLPADKEVLMSVLGTIALVLASQTPVVADAPTWSIGAGLGTIVTGGLGPAAPTVSAGVEARLAHLGAILRAYVAVIASGTQR